MGNIIEPEKALAINRKGVLSSTNELDAELHRSIESLLAGFSPSLPPENRIQRVTIEHRSHEDSSRKLVIRIYVRDEAKPSEEVMRIYDSIVEQIRKSAVEFFPDGFPFVRFMSMA